MAWRERLVEASFRGVPFDVQAEAVAGGRRKAVLEAPGLDVPIVQDLGRRARRVDLEAFVIGPDYLDRRDALLTALERPGVGDLVHPYYGRSKAHATRFRVVESTAEGAIARLSIEFVLGDAPRQLTAVPSVDAQLEDAAEQTREAALEDVEDAVTPESSSFERDAAREAARDASRELAEVIEGSRRSVALEIGEDEAAALIRQALALPDAVLDQGADFVAWLQSYQNSGIGLRNALGRRAEGFKLLRDAVRSLLGLGGEGSRARVRYTAAGSLLAIAAQSGADVGAGWASASEALDARADFLDLADELLERAPDATGDGVADLRAAVIDAIPPPDVQLPLLTTYTPADREPALVAAARIYGSPDLADDIATRNGVAHPAFLPAGRPLEVVVRD